jgi:hypothetical protein
MFVLGPKRCITKKSIAIAIMFRSTKKKGRKRVIRASRNSDEYGEEESKEEEDPTVVVRHKKRKPKGMVVRSFDARKDEGPEELSSKSQSKKNGRRKERV